LNFGIYLEIYPGKQACFGASLIRSPILPRHIIYAVDGAEKLEKSKV
jgi:hypothetical protein